MFAPAGDSFSFSVPSFHLSSTAKLVVAAQLAALLIMLGVQHVVGLSIYSLDNVSLDGSLNWLYIAEVVVFAPIREELVFRGVLLATFYRRVGGQSAELMLRAVFATSFFFGGIHAINFFSTDSSPAYVSVQVIFGLLIGIVFAADYARNGIFGCLVMHAVNNLCSSFVSRRDMMDEPIVICGYVQGAVVFTAFAMLAVKKLREAKSCRFPVVDGMGIEPLPYSAEEEAEEKPKKMKKKRKAKVEEVVEEVTEEVSAPAPASEPEVAPVPPELPAIRSRRGGKAAK
jgi:membrane protease YdiL (CAAX protease family)